MPLLLQPVNLISHLRCIGPVVLCYLSMESALFRKPLQQRLRLNSFQSIRSVLILFKGLIITVDDSSWSHYFRRESKRFSRCVRVTERAVDNVILRRGLSKISRDQVRVL